ncbi:MAG: HypC/HybG/HupF family hydrogenase formation chaperone [bacterium]
MCLAIPGKVEEIDGNVATVDIMGVKNRIAIDMVKNVQIGDYLMIHAGYAIEKIDEAEAMQTIELFHELGGLLSKDDV